MVGGGDVDMLLISAVLFDGVAGSAINVVVDRDNGSNKSPDAEICVTRVGNCMEIENSIILIHFC